MEDSFSSAWLMYSIFHSENEDKYSNLTDIIAVADYSNHAIMTYSEFNEGLTILSGLGFVSSKDDKLSISDSFKDWWSSKFAKKKRLYVQYEISEINKHISKLKSSIYESTDSTINSELDFDKAVNEYLDKMNSNK
jgi:hypothetical protein